MEKIMMYSTPVQHINEILNEIIASTDYAAMSDEERIQHRKDMLALQVKTKDAVAKTGCKNLNFDDDEIRSYIDVILLNGFALIETNPRNARKFDDAQNLRRYKSLIRERVEKSQFGEAFFNIPELALL